MPGSPRARLVALAVGTACLAGLLTALPGAGTAAARVAAAPARVSAGDAASGLTAGPVAPALAVAPVPKLVWRSCGSPFLCASAAVPLDWSRPRGRSISLALVKLPASDRAHRIGTLFVNPGGPGGSGVDYVMSDPEAFPAAVRTRFDIVGFDPRFVGGSRPSATCMFDDAFVDFLAGQPYFPVTHQQVHDAVAAEQQYTARCATRADLAFASTGSVARDLDLLRQAVGDSRLTYVGYSYGTYLGQVYAQLFPRRIRAMVLDGVVDGQAWRRGVGTQWQAVPFSARINSARASSQALGQFLALCRAAGPVRCALANEPDPAAAFAELAQRVKLDPLDLGGGDVLDYPTLVSATTSVLYSPMDWQAFADELQMLWVAMSAPAGDVPVGDLPSVTSPTAGRPTAGPPTAGRSTGGATGRASVQASGSAAAVALRTAARRIADRAPADGRPRLAADGAPWERPSASPSTAPVPPPADNGMAAFDAVACEDSLNPKDAWQWAATADRLDASIPYFGRAWTWSSLACATWPFADKNAYGGSFGGRLSAPLLVVGTRYDPATPYAGAVTVAARYPGSRLLTVEGFGHTSGATPNRCATAAVSRYLVSGRLPAAGTRCRQDVAPFPAGS